MGNRKKLDENPLWCSGGIFFATEGTEKREKRRKKEIEHG